MAKEKPNTQILEERNEAQTTRRLCQLQSWNLALSNTDVFKDENTVNQK